MSTYETASLAISVVVGIAAVAALVVYSAQLIAMRKASMAQGAIALVGFLQDKDVREARRVVRGLDGKEIAEWTEGERLSASLVAANYDVAAALLRGGLAPGDLIAANWGPSITHCHEVLKPFIAETRQQHGGHPGYWSNFDWLSAAANQDQA